MMRAALQGLSVEQRGGRAVCTKDGAGGEKEGDVLRFTTSWVLGAAQGGGDLMDSAMAFSGALKWQFQLFEVDKAGSWDKVVEALTSNTPERTDSVQLVFERPLQSGAV